MFCIKCGRKLTEQEATVELCCSGCGARVAAPFQAPPAPAQPTLLPEANKFSVDAVFLILVIGVPLCFLLAATVGYRLGAVVLLLLLESTLGVCMVVAASRKSGILLWAAVGVLAVWWLSYRGIPRFIRLLHPVAVPILLFLASTLGLLCTYLIQRTVARDKAAQLLDELVGMQFLDSDLMLLMSYPELDIYLKAPKLAGYYLLRARLHGMVDCQVMPPQGELPHRIAITIDPRRTPQELEAYCQANPQVQHLIDYLNQARKEEREVTLPDVLCHVAHDPQIQGPGGKATLLGLDSLRPAIDRIGYGALILLYTFGLSRFVMELCMGTGTGISTLMLILSVFFSAIYWFAWASLRDHWLRTWITEGIIQVKARQFPYLDAQLRTVLFGDRSFTKEEGLQILRAYATYPLSLNDAIHEDRRLYHQQSFLDSLIFAGILAKDATLEFPGSGVESAGGCGGCGGCGDA